MTTLNATIYAALKAAAENIATHDVTMGAYALRKIEHISATTDLQTLIRTGEDIVLIAETTVLKVVLS